ncbi:MAG: hypothetical protein H6Q68_1553 [Firmicutes bacterium]|nr:hypothetical protein [Bacillota bacterium]
MATSYLKRSPIIATTWRMEKFNELDEMLQFVPSSIREAVIITDFNANILFMNSTAEKLTGYSQIEVLRTTVIELFEIIDKATGKLIEFPVGKIKHDVYIKFGKGTLLVKKNFEKIFVDGSISQIVDDTNYILGFVIVFYDMTEERRLEKQLIYTSMHDILTGLSNRTCFENEFLNIRGQQYAPVGLIICDIDGLKIINDTLGHRVGDNMIIAVANILKQSFRKEDIVARIGGDEFAVLLPRSSSHSLREACLRIRDNISKYNENKSGLLLSVSLGYTVDNKLSANITSLFKKADRNMYKEKLQQKSSSRRAAINTIMRMIGARDFITEGHCERLKILVELMAFSLGLSEEKVNELMLLAEFHDIGKVGISDKVLLKQGPLTSEERKEMQKHCEIGQCIAVSSPDLAHIANWILKHHEWWNGCGYPKGIKGENIPLECRILAIVDAYDAMTNDRPYRKGMSQEKALAELENGAGIQFDPVLVSEFRRILVAIKIYVAISAKDVMLEIEQAYMKDNPQKNIVFRFGGSGELKQHIEDGALADIFIPAALGQMDELQKKDLLIDETRKKLLENEIVLITSKNSSVVCEFEDLAGEKINKIAIGDPNTVPAGKYARDILMSLEILEKVKSKLVFAKDVRQALKFVETGNIDVGIVYRTDAKTSDKVKIIDQVVPFKAYSPVVYPIAILKNNTNIEDGKEFVKFLSSNKARMIFERHGFVVC